jgi:hypothetical protein
MQSKSSAQDEKSARDSVLRRLTARFVKALSDLLEASEPKRKRPRNLYIRGMTSQGLVTRPHSGP